MEEYTSAGALSQYGSAQCCSSDGSGGDECGNRRIARCEAMFHILRDWSTNASPKVVNGATRSSCRSKSARAPLWDLLHPRRRARISARCIPPSVHFTALARWVRKKPELDSPAFSRQQSTPSSPSSAAPRAAGTLKLLLGRQVLQQPRCWRGRAPKRLSAWT